MKGIVSTGLLLTQAYTFYYVGILLLGSGYPKLLVLATTLTVWILTVRLLNHFTSRAIRPAVGLFFVLSPLFLLPSAISLWRIIIVGLSPQHLLISILSIPIAMAIVNNRMKTPSIATITVAWLLLLLGLRFNLGIPIYMAGILSAAGGIKLSLTPLIRTLGQSGIRTNQP